MVLYDSVTTAVEVKMPGKKLTKGEAEFKNDWEANGGSWKMVTTVEEARGLIESLEGHIK